MENVVFKNADATLDGTLTLPENCDRDTPVLLMVSGSGPHNRDGEMFNHRPFAVIADFLARKGVATLRYDDRGVGKSLGKTKNISIEDITSVELLNNSAPNGIKRDVFHCVAKSVIKQNFLFFVM